MMIKRGPGFFRHLEVMKIVLLFCTGIIVRICGFLYPGQVCSHTLAHGLAITSTMFTGTDPTDQVPFSS